MSLEDDGYEEVAQFGEYDYNWKITKVYKHDDRYFADTQSGCSCYGWEESLPSALVEIPDIVSMEMYYKSDMVGSDMDKWFDVRDRMIELGLAQRQ